MRKTDLSQVSVKEFVELLENLDKTEAGENLFLRCYPDGGSYISNDNGSVDYEFPDFEVLLCWLKEKYND
ncbi:MAG: hypothetical protein MAG551_01094 [Candidatus Scalindua arabica]|uniref:Uncharacterized protein n=1 Tax=Candidatus Scalindua arabica TaxID=1127984 RepID=A0A941W3W2_9BACT|nr:hypothetical protein [Candidatus Scalindua arabica]